ncbi:MAG: acyl-CoA dehydrogenase family protein [Acidimicrobiia bacterium]
MDFTPNPRVVALCDQLEAFIATVVEPAESVYAAEMRTLEDPHAPPPILETLKTEARERGLWNLFFRDSQYGPGLSVTEYAPLAECMGMSRLAPEVTNCSAPDTGNMEVLAEFGTPEQRDQWLTPLLHGEIRSCFAMSEPWVASSDATNIESRIERDGDEYVVRAHKWWTSGAASSRCRVALVLGITDPDADRHARHSIVLVPMDLPGVRVVRTLPVFGFDEGGGHAEVLFEEVRVPISARIGAEGAGFAIAQSRLGPGRVHHCMRAIGLAEKALRLMTQRAATRVAFGKPLAAQGVIQDWIAESRIAIDQARLLVLSTAWKIDTADARAARTEIAAIKVAAARVANEVIDRAIQVFGGAGLSNDWPLAEMYAHARALRIVDGPDEVHKALIARAELAAQSYEATATTSK